MTETSDAMALSKSETTPASASRPSPLTALRRHKWLSSVMVVIGLGLGAGAAVAQGNSYTAESRLAVGGNNITPELIPGYELAAEELAADYARYVSSADEKASLLSTLGSATVSEITNVSASPIPTSTVVAVDVTGKTQAATIAAANAVANNLSKEIDAIVAQSTPATTLKQLDATIAQVTNQTAVVANDKALLAAATPATAGAARAKLAVDQDTLSSLAVQQTAESNLYENDVANPTVSGVLDVVQTAVITRNDLHSRLERYGLVGLVLGFGLALLMSTWWEVRRAKRRARRSAKAARE